MKNDYVRFAFSVGDNTRLMLVTLHTYFTFSTSDTTHVVYI